MNSIGLQVRNNSRVDIRRDLWIARQLGRIDLYSGVTSPRDRIERQRHEIAVQQLADIRLGGRETWAQAFERWHGEPLAVSEDVA